jgi:predicted enzyme related to lactoylglutathione lyase
VDDVEAAHDEVTARGARLLRAAGGGESGDDFQVYADPAGHPFCLCWIKQT